MRRTTTGTVRIHERFWAFFASGQTVAQVTEIPHTAPDIVLSARRHLILQEDAV